VLHNAQQEVQRTLAQDPTDVTPLFPGIPYRRLDTRWGLFVE
jgi:hypothetical protein